MVQEAIVCVRPLAPERVNPRVPRPLSEVLMRLLAKDRAERYPGGAALHAALVEVARGRESAWDASLFEWEEFPPSREGAAAERHIVLPSMPRLEWPTSPPGALFAAR